MLGPRAVAALALGLLPVLLAWGQSEFLLVLAAWDLAILLALTIDALRLAPAENFALELEAPELWSFGRPQRIVWRLRSRSRAPLTVWLQDDWPPELGPAPPPARWRLQPGEGVELERRLRPSARGDFELAAPALRWAGPWGLVRRTRTIGAARTIRVYPDVEGLREAALLEGLDRAQQGVKRLRAPGAGLAFESLREYVAGDDFRRIDWAATARQERPIVRDYETERSQPVLLLVDTGRLTAAPAGPGTALDLLVTAALHLAQVALLRGDTVGLVVYAHQVKAYLPPRKGRGQLLQVLEQLRSARSEPYESDYDAAYGQLTRRQSRRALVAGFTQIVDQRTSRRLLERNLALVPRHLPLLVTLADQDIARALSAPARGPLDVHRRIVARELADDREAALRLLSRRGIYTISAAPARISTAALSAYLDIKYRGRL